MLNKTTWYYYLLLFAPVVGIISFTVIRYQGWQVLTYLIIPLYIIFILTRKKKIIIPRFTYFYILYALFIFVWNLNNGYLEEKGFIKYIFNNYHVYFILLLILIYNTSISTIFYLRLVKLVQIILLVALGGAIIQFFIPNWMIRPEGWGENLENVFLDRRPSVFTYVSDNDHGISILAYFSLVLSFYINKREKKLWLFIFLIIIGLYSMLTNTRYIMAAFILVIFQMRNIKGREGKFKYVFFGLAGGAFIYIIITSVLNIDLVGLYEIRLFSEGSIQETTRYAAYLNFMRFFPESPFFGTGVHLTEEIRSWSRYYGSSQIHVGYFSHLVSYGLVGSILLFSFWFGLTKDLYRKAKITGYYGPFFAFLVFLWFNWTAVDYYLRYPGLIIAFVFSQYYYMQAITETKK
jgi:hypothetical protein